jgi:protoporphyrinogen oxidase
MAMIGSRVVVIGGGFAGIAAAAALRARGATVTLLDAGRMLGGRARSDELAGMIIDTGVQLITTSSVRAVRLMTPGGKRWDASGSGDGQGPSLARAPGRDAYVRDGMHYPIQLGSVRSLLAFGGLGAAEKLKLATQLVPVLARHRGALDAALTRIPPALDAVSARAFVSNRIGGHTADVLVEPLLNGAYTTRGDEVSLAFYLMAGRYGSEGEVLAPAAGWSSALATALRGAAIELGVRVDALEIGARAIRVCAAGDRSWEADGAIIATGPRAARALLAPHLPRSAELLGWLARVPLVPTWTAALALDVAAPREAFGLFRDAGATRVVSACAVHGAKLGSPPPDRDVVLAWPTPDAARRLTGRTAREIVDAMLPEIEALIPAVRGHIVHARVYRFEEGTPVAHPGFAADRAYARRLTSALPFPLVLAGDYLTAPLVEGAVASGEQAASLLVQRLSS